MSLPLSAALAQVDARISLETRGQHRFSLNQRPVLRWYKNEQSPDELTSLSISLATRLFGSSLDYCLCTTHQIDAARTRKILAQATQAVEWRQIDEKDNPALAAALHQHGLTGKDFGPWWRWFPERLRRDTPEIVISDDLLIWKMPLWLPQWRKGLAQILATRGESPVPGISGNTVTDFLEITRSFEGAIALPLQSDISAQLIGTLSALKNPSQVQAHCYSPSKIFGRALDQLAAGTISASDISACAPGNDGQKIGFGPEETPGSVHEVETTECFRWLGGSVQWGIPGWTSNDYFMKSLAVFARDFAGQSVLELGTSRGKLAAVMATLGCSVTTVDHQDRGASKNLGGLAVKVILKEAYDFLVDSSEQYRLIVVDLHGNTQSDWERLAPVLIKNLQAGGALFLGNLNLSEVADWKLETGVRWFLDQLPKNWKCEYFTASLPGFAIAWKPT
jgi:hypothetical protein